MINRQRIKIYHFSSVLLSMDSEDEAIKWIIWSPYERAFVTSLGQTFKKFHHIPLEYQHLVTQKVYKDDRLYHCKHGRNQENRDC